jgi:hypothetical protein
VGRDTGPGTEAGQHRRAARRAGPGITLKEPSMVSWRTCLAVLALAAPAGTAAEAGLFIINNDEWTLSDAGYANAGATSAGQFATNIATAFGATGGGRIHAYSTNFGVVQSSLAATLSGLGVTYTTGTGIAFDLPTLQTYDGIVLGGTTLSAAQRAVLLSYLAGGGNVYLAAGTGAGGAVAEAAAWNPILNAFGLAFEGVYNRINGLIDTSGIADPVFAGTTALFQNNGNTIVEVGAPAPGFSVALYDTPQGEGLYAVVRAQVVPEPAGAIILASALIGLGLLARRRG